MRIIFLGTNGWYDSKTGRTPCILLETKNRKIILDAGSGIGKLDQYADKDDRIDLFLSHLHLDHINGLHILDKFRFERGLTIHVPKGSKRLLNQLIAVPFTKRLKDLRYNVTIEEVEEKKYASPFVYSCRRLQHSEICYGFRFELDGKIVSYCTDTGPCKNAVTLSKDSDALISECSLKISQTDQAWGHLNPKQAAMIARESGTSLLALTHFDASNYEKIKDRERAAIEARRIFSNTIAAVDGLEVKV